MTQAARRTRPRRWSIRTRLIVSLAAVVSVAILVSTVISTVVVGRFLEDRVTYRLATTAQRVQATLTGMRGVTLDLATIAKMAQAESTAVVIDDGTSPPLWVNADAELARTLLSLDLRSGEPQAVDGRPGFFAVDVDTAHLGLVVRDGGRVVRPVRLVLGIDASEQIATIRVIVLANTAGVVLSIGLLVILTVVIVSRGLRPLRTMAEHAQAFADGDRAQRLSVPQDDPDISRLAASINDAFDARQEAEERLRAFVADASHELRTPLTTATGWIELYFQGGLDDPAQRDHAMERVRTQLGRMRALTDELALLARLDRVRDLARDPVDLTALAVEVTGDARVMNPEREFTVSSTGPALLLGDGPKLQQVLVNLLENAVQHTPPGSPIDVTVIPADRNRPGTSHVLLVTDHGPGIALRDQPHIFERFWRSDASRDRHTGGSGLGLSIVASIVAAHGGRAGVTSTPGRGTTIRVTLPATPPVPAGPPDQAKRTEPVPSADRNADNRVPSA